MTKPCPEKPSWKASPDERINDIGLKPPEWMEVCRDADQATTASVSTYVGASTVSTTGVPRVVIASLPVPVKSVLKSPPPIMPALPIILMSHCSVGSNASTLTPFTENPSVPSSSITCTSDAQSAKNTSPVPVARIRSTPSPVTAFLSIFPMPPADW